jgi:hypothetical protein
MEVTRYSETSVDFQRTTWLYIPEDKTLHKDLFVRSIKLKKLNLIFWMWFPVQLTEISDENIATIFKVAEK